MLELGIAGIIFFGLPIAIIGWGIIIKRRENQSPDPLEDISNWGSQDIDRRKAP